MTIKQLRFREDARDKIRRGVDALADAVKVTLGPRGRTVIFNQDYGPPQIVNSGVGYNAATGEYGDMLERGVIDPAKVTRLAQQNAASIAELIVQA